MVDMITSKREWASQQEQQFQNTEGPVVGFAQPTRHFDVRSAGTSVPNQVYLVGSLRNSEVPELAVFLRNATEWNVFDDWFAAGPEADDHWKTYERHRGRTYEEALKGAAAKNVFNFDRQHISESSHVLLVMPAGKSGHMEVAWAAGIGKKTAILLESNTDDRWDVMYQFVDRVFRTREDVVKWLTIE